MNLNSRKPSIHPENILQFCPWAIALLAGWICFSGFQIRAAIVGPYQTDANTLHLWHLDEPSTPAFDVTPSASNLGALGGGAVLGATSFGGFGSALDTSTNIGAYLAGLTLVNSTADDFPITYSDPTTGAFTFEAIIRVDFNPANAPRTAQLALIDGENDGTTNRPWQWRLSRSGTNYQMAFFNLDVSGSVTVNLPMTGPDAIAQGSWYHVAVTYDGNTTSNMNFYWTLMDNSRTQANLIGTGTIPALAPLGGGNIDFCIGNIGRTTPNTAWPGLIDEVRMSKIARAPTDMMFAVNPLGVTIVQSPNSQIVYTGHPASFSVSASGTPNLTYQWRTNGVPISGATQFFYNIASVQLTDALNYDVIVANSVNSQTSAVATLTVLTTPRNLTWIGTANNQWTTLTNAVNWDSNGDHAADAFFIDGDAVTFDDNGAAVPAVNISGGTRSVSGLIINANLSGYSFTGSGITGSGGLSFTGTNTVLLDNAANTYTGPTSIAAGLLKLGNNDANGSLGTVGAIANQGILDFNTTAILLFTNSISGTGNFIKDSTGTVDMLGSNTFSGSITVNTANWITSLPGLGNCTNITLNGFSSPGATFGSSLILTNNAIIGSNVVLNMNVSTTNDNRASLMVTNSSCVWNGPIVLNGGSSVTLWGSGGSLTVNGPITGSGFTNYLAMRGAASTNFINSLINLPNGNFQKTDNNTWVLGTANSIYLTFRALGGGVVKWGINNAMATGATLVSGGGLLDLNGFNQSMVAFSDFTSGLTIITNGSATSDSTIGFNQSGFIIANRTAFADSGATGGHRVSVTFDGGGIYAVGTTNTHTGTTTVQSASTLILNINGSISQSTLNVIGGSTIDPTFRSDGTLTLGTNQTLRGDGAFNVLGTLSNTAGVIEIKLNKSGATLSNDSINQLSAISYGGTLKLDVTASPALTTADSFTIFNAGSRSGAFANFVPAVPALGLAWDTSTLAIDGTLRITTSNVPLTPTNITSVVVGVNSLKLSWPTNYVGWRLQAQTNAPGVGIGTNWFTVPGSVTTNQVLAPFNTNAGSVFYRMIYP